jgi:hypothetical protein
MKHTYLCWILTAAVLTTIGCASRAPSISHVHIGHAMTGWHDTPDKDGLFIVAEKKAAEALDQAAALKDANGNLDRMKADISAVSRLTDGGATAAGTKNVYGVKQALNGAVSHITYAATSPDTTQNTRTFADRFAVNASGVIDRCDLITALSGDIMASNSADEVELLAPEVAKLARANLHGEDLNGDGRIGSTPAEYGLIQLRRDIEAMIDNEDPPYTTVSSWYLFNLIRLPDGTWKFRNRYADGDDPYAGGGGGGY